MIAVLIDLLVQLSVPILPKGDSVLEIPDLGVVVLRGSRLGDCGSGSKVRSNAWTASESAVYSHQGVDPNSCLTLRLH